MSWSFWTNYVLALAIVALVLGALFAIARVVTRRRTFGSTNRRFVTVLESTALSQQTFLHLVKAGNRYLLIGASGANVSTLAEVEPSAIGSWLAHRRGDASAGS
ncbi:MAG: flagellar biosynthetic protein FliO [Candidatus Tumulicola sp.]